jgi:hypothetical protein
MPIHIPPQSTRRWSGIYRGDFYGTLWKTFNIDLDRREGKASLSRRTISVADSSQTGNALLGSINAFVRTNADNTDRWWALSNANRLFKSTGINPDSWSVDTLASTPTNPRDMWIHENDSDSGAGENQLLVTIDSDIFILNDTANNAWASNWWVTTKGGPALDSGVPHPGEYFRLIRKSLIGSRNKIHTLNDSEDVVASRLTFPPYLQTEYIFTTQNRAWILCSNTRGGPGAIVEWDGSKQSANEIYDIESSLPLSGVGWKNRPIVISNSGKILELTGDGFVPMVRNGQEIAFPIVDEPGNQFTATVFTGRGIRPRGMVVGEDGLIYINVGTFDVNSYKQNSGIWCLNPITGRMYQKYSPMNDTNDYGHQRVGQGGAIAKVPVTDTSTDYQQGFVFGATTGTAAAPSNTSRIFNIVPLTNSNPSRGYFITQYIAADDIKDFFDSLWVRFRRFVTAANRIVLKGQGVRSIQTVSGLPIQLSSTWTSTTTFTATNPADSDDILVGDEVEVLNGDNAGVLAHISAISGSQGALQTFTIDETVVSSTTTFTARFDRWRKLGVISNSTKYEDMVEVGIESSFCRFKVEMRGLAREMEVESLIVDKHPSVNKQ